MGDSNCTSEIDPKSDFAITGEKFKDFICYRCRRSIILIIGRILI